MLKNTPNPIDPSAPFQKLVDDVRPKLAQQFDKDDPVLVSLQEGYRYETAWNSFFKKISEDRSNAPDWDTLNEHQRAHWLVHRLFRKLPSPGRIYRFWRTAETFFDDLLKRFRDIATAHENRWRTRRLCFKPHDQTAGNGWEDRETYLGRWRNEPFEVLYLEDQKAFVTISNLARCFRPKETAQALEQETQPIMVKGDDGRQRELRAKSVSTPEKIGCYAPVIPLDLSPQRFRVLVPLDCATACLEAAIAKWQEEFARVWDRMPLRIGVVAFPRLTPFQAVIEAVRHLEEALDENGTETWRVIGCCHHDGTMALTLQHDRGQECVALPCKLPDGRDDVFYPHLRVQDRGLRFPRDFRHPDGKVYRHVTDLLPGDGVEVDASRIAAVFMDTTARRFEPPAVRPLGEFARMRAVWEQPTRWSPSLSALRGAWSELEERAQTWRDAHGRWLPGAEAQWRELAGAILQDRLGLGRCAGGLGGSGGRRHPGLGACVASDLAQGKFGRGAKMTESCKIPESYKRFPVIGMGIDPIHVGTGGERLGRVDNTIVRDPVTRVPKIPGSSLAGVMRSYAAMAEGKFPDCAGQGQPDKDGKGGHCGKADCPVCTVFGFARGSGGGFAGLAAFSDAHVLLFPVATREGPVWLTCPDALRRVGPEIPGNLHDAIYQQNGKTKLNLGWLLLDRKDSLPNGSSWPSLDESIPGCIRQRVAIVSDKIFSHVVNSNLEVRTSVSINPETGAAQETALFTYEALPRATCWSGMLFAKTRRISKSAGKQ